MSDEQFRLLIRYLFIITLMLSVIAGRVLAETGGVFR